MHKKSIFVWAFLSIWALASCKEPVTQKALSTSIEIASENDKKPCLEMADAYAQIGTKNQLTNKALLQGLVEHVMRRNLPKKKMDGRRRKDSESIQ